jgi:hypothetical protein
MALTLDKEQKLRAASLIDFFKAHEAAWTAAVKARI